MLFLSLLLFFAVSRVKQGECPSYPTDLECPAPETLKPACLFDDACSGTKKCCNDGCTLKCLEPKAIPAVKPVVGPPGDPGDKGEPVRLIFYLLHIKDIFEDIQMFKSLRFELTPIFAGRTTAAQ